MLLIRLLNFLEINLRKPKIIIGIALTILVIYLAPLLIYGQDLYFQPYDNLDSNVIWYKILAQSGMIFSDSNAIIPNMMGGLPRHSYGSEFNVMLWLFYFFTPFTAIVINEIVIHVVAFGSMWIFLSHFVIKPTRGNIIYIVAGSLYFALLQFWSWGGISVAAMPLVLYAFLNIRANIATWKDWAVLILVPLYSSLVLVYFFFLILMGAFWFWDSLRKRAIQWKLIGAIVLMGIVFFSVEYRLIYVTFFDHTFVSHRSEFSLLFSQDTLNSFRGAQSFFLNGQEHTRGNHYLVLLPLVGLAALLGLLSRKLKRGETVVIVMLFILGYVVDIWSVVFTTRYFFPLSFVVSAILIWKFSTRDKLLPALFLVLMIISLWAGFWFHEFWRSLKPVLPFIESFNMSRFIFIAPMIWGILATLSLWMIGRKVRYISIMVLLFCLFQGYVGVKNAIFMVREKEDKISFKTYYAQEAFAQMREYIGKPQNSYRIASIGIDPAISLYNGFYTIDGYSVNYPLEYKHCFEKIIRVEAQKNIGIKKIFHEWGSKCYVYTQKVSFMNKNKPENYSNTQLDIKTMYALGARYIVTAEKIPNPQSGFVYQKSFGAPGEYWTLHLYEISPSV